MSGIKQFRDTGKPVQPTWESWPVSFAALSWISFNPRVERPLRKAIAYSRSPREFESAQAWQNVVKMMALKAFVVHVEL